MKLYNSKRELVELEDFDYLTSGGCAHIFRKGDIVVKQYKYESDYHIYVNKKVFKALKEIGAPNIVKLHDYYYYYDSFISRMLPVDAYSMDYVQDDKIHLIDQPSEYLFKIADDLEETAKILSDNKIHIRDPHHGNIIFGKDKATLIDVDSYLFNYSRHDALVEMNRDAIIETLTSKLVHEFQEEDYGYWFPTNMLLYRLQSKDNKTIKEVLETIIDEETPRKSMQKRKSLYK